MKFTAVLVAFLSTALTVSGSALPADPQVCIVVLLDIANYDRHDLSRIDSSSPSVKHPTEIPTLSSTKEIDSRSTTAAPMAIPTLALDIISAVSTVYHSRVNKKRGPDSECSSPSWPDQISRKTAPLMMMSLWAIPMTLLTKATAG